MLIGHDSIFPESLTGEQLDMLLSVGWYRMHQFIFTTTHLEKGEFLRVHWLRYPVADIREHASHKNIRTKNKSFRFTIEKLTYVTPAYEALFAHYRSSIDFEGPRSISQCLFGEEGGDRGVYATHCISVFDGEKLIAGGYFDVGEISGTSILHFFDPEYSRFSLGKYLMLLTADFLKSGGYKFYYPGYLVAGDGKMDYKLFIGKEVTQYFDPENMSWKSFEEGIMVKEVRTMEEEAEILLVFRGQ